MKRFLFSFLLTHFCFFCFSQVNFGIKSGINIATTKNLWAYPKNRIGWYAGGFSKIQLKKKFFLQPELIYSTKGNGFNQKNPLNAPNGVYRFNYLNLPILLGYKLDNSTSFFLGPEFGFLTSVRRSFGHNENFDKSKDFPQKFDFDLDIGLHYLIKKDIAIEVRYNYGLNTLYSVDALGIRHTNINGAHRVFQVGLSYPL